jgi:hypothetical protein
MILFSAYFKSRPVNKIRRISARGRGRGRRTVTSFYFPAVAGILLTAWFGVWNLRGVLVNRGALPTALQQPPLSHKLENIISLERRTVVVASLLAPWFSGDPFNYCWSVRFPTRADTGPQRQLDPL